ncbi:hypothetical protein QE829_22780, partial [Escherichia coli]|nr:hypothetical protein [Escherichia coli]
HRALSEHKTLSISWSHYPEMSEYQFEVFQYETLNPKKMSHTPYLKRPLPNEKDINYGVEIEIPSGKRIRLSNHYQNIIP